MERKMNFRTWRSVLIIFGAALVACAPGISMDPPRAVLVLKDASGERVRLSDYRGKIVVLNFWATWCAPCRDEIPYFVELEKEYRSRGVVFIGASLDDERTSRQIPDYLARYGVNYPVWYGAGRGDLDRLGFDQAVPATAFLDQEGRVGARVLGEIRRREIKERLDWLLGDWTGPAPQALVNHLGSFSGAR
jgi:thiol-disulfide isomerase/thioredoxin